MDPISLLSTILGAGVPVLAAALALAGRLSRIESSVERLRADVDRAIAAAEQADGAVGSLRERVAVIEAGCRAQHPTRA